jgi:hypothetical protein
MEHGFHHDAHGMLLGIMWKYRDEDQVRTLILGMIDSRIKMKQHWIAQMQDKFETYKRACDMIGKGRKK